MKEHPRSTLNLLLVNASARNADSVSRSLADELVSELQQAESPLEIIQRDLVEAPPFIDADWITANFTPEEERTADQRETLADSDALVAELKAADTLVIATPIYNFGIPAALKAWIDMVARARLTFRYTEKGPKGLLNNKRAYVVVASGGTEVGSDIDFATGYLRHVLGFLGITEVEIIAADRLTSGKAESIATARAQIRRATLSHRGRHESVSTAV